MTDLTQMRLSISGEDLSDEDREALTRSLLDELNEHERGVANFAPGADAPSGSKGDLSAIELVLNATTIAATLLTTAVEVWLRRQEKPVIIQIMKQLGDGSLVQQQIPSSAPGSDAESSQQMTG